MNDVLGFESFLERPVPLLYIFLFKSPSCFEDEHYDSNW